MNDVDKLEALKAARDAARAAAYENWNEKTIAAWTDAGMALMRQAQRMADKAFPRGSAEWNECVSALLD